MKKHRFPLMLVCAVMLFGTVLADDDDGPRFQYGFKFGLVRNGFEALPSSPTNPFSAVKVDGKLGFLGGAFYDIALFRGGQDIYFTTAAAYKFLNFKGDFATTDTPPVLGDFRVYFHVLDLPVGVKVAFNKMNGHPYVGAGVQTDFILAHSQSTNTTGVTQDYNLVPAYNSRTNVGFYFNGGFEIPSSSFMYVIDFKYIWWGLDNFTGAETFYKRNKGELQFTFGIKIH
ncbi:MAG: outer membrane beta-barrel protein [Acidobacteria bacterium]|nr:outer membrane beta-barrel protein [Acidobacteriota bacterium]